MTTTNQERTIDQKLSLEMVTVAVKKVTELQQQIEKDLKEAEEARKRIEANKNKLSSVMSILGSNVTSLKKGRIPGAKDVKRRFRRTKEELAMGLSRDQAKKQRKIAS